MEIEIPKVLEIIEYPFPVKKSDLKSFTSGRALGNVLGMLEWIVDSLTVRMNAKNNFQTTDSLLIVFM